MSESTNEFDRRPCPYCGAMVKVLPSHLPDCDETGEVVYDE